jgi:3-hydroxyisobutyrate dehydrogenase
VTVSDTNRRAAVIGLGQMGRGIAQRLDAAGLLCGAWDECSDTLAAADLTAHVRQTPVSDLIGKADLLLFVVPSTDEIKRTLTGVAKNTGCTVVDLTTSNPIKSQALAKDLAGHGMQYLDAAMTGGAAATDDGTLTLMVGGAAEDLAGCRTVLETIAARIIHLGPVGAGHTMKLVHNLILHSSFLATCEGLRLAERAGLDVDQAVEVLNAGNARSFVTEVRFPRDILSGTMMARSKVSNLEKDLGLAQDFANSLEARVPYGEMTRTLLAQAIAAGHSETDFSWLFPLYEELVDGANVEK